jgi:tetratricopeptide (TPR) repeat protein
VGMIQLFYRCDFAAAEREINRALALDPGDLGALDYHSYYLLEMGRYNEAIAEKKIVLASDPVSVGTNAELGMYLMRGGRNGEAIAQLRRTLELDPNHAPALARLGLAYANTGQYAPAIEQLKHAALIEPFPPRLGALGEVYARWGKRQQALAVVRDLKEMMPQHYVPASLIALIYARLGEHESALQWLARARIGDRPTVADPGFDSLRADARFSAQAARLAPGEACPRLL